MKQIKGRFSIVVLFLFFAVSCENNEIITPNISIDKKEIKLSAHAQTISIALSSNVDFDVKTCADWLTASKNYSGQESIISIGVTEYNETEKDRTGSLEIIPNGTTEVITITIVQEAMGYIHAKDNVFYISSDEQKLTIPVQNNYDYDVIIPGGDESWIKIDKTSDTKATVETNLTLNISKNEEYTPRKSQIIISIPSYSDKDTITIIQDEGFESLRKLIRSNTDCSIFYQALEQTGLEDSLISYIDNNYPIIDYEWTKSALHDNYSGIHYYETAYEKGDNADRVAIPDIRCFKYTVFLVTDSILSTYRDRYCTGGIHNIDEMREYAYKVYPEGKEYPDTSRASSLNKLISYHILPSWIPYDQLNTRQIELRQRHLFLTEFDMEDFYETLLPHSVMRISTPYITNEIPLGIYINRKGSSRTTLSAEGVRIIEIGNELLLPANKTNTCANGGYHYVNKLLLYDVETRTNVLDCRMRTMASTLSPDFINSGARGRLNGDRNNGGIKNIDKMSYTFISGYCKNVYWNTGSELYVRYRDKSFGYYNGDEIEISGDYDIAFKLPPVPYDGLYEIRYFNNSLESSSNCNRGIVQFYLGKKNNQDEGNSWNSWNWKPCGDLVNMRLNGIYSSIGMIPDDDDTYSSLSETQKKMVIHQNDQDLRTRGYMKAPDSYTAGMSTDYSGDPIRNDANCYRKIVCNEYLESNTDYYLRIQKKDTIPNSVCVFCFVEIVPEAIYSEINGWEDKH